MAGKDDAFSAAIREDIARRQHSTEKSSVSSDIGELAALVSKLLNEGLKRTACDVTQASESPRCPNVRPRDQQQK